MALVELLLSPLPSHVSTARLVVVAAARRAGLGEDVLDEIRLAVGEACSRAVALHERYAPQTPVRLTVMDDPAGLTLSVTDAGPAAGPVPDDPAADLLADGHDEHTDPAVALAVLSGLVDDVQVDPTPAGTTVTLRWPLPAGAAPGTTVLA